MNTLQFRILASIADPDTFWHFTYHQARDKWEVYLTGCQPVEYHTLGDIIHNDKFPRSTLNTLSDVAAAAGLDRPRARTWGG
jgi:hypothetical protein